VQSAFGGHNNRDFRYGTITAPVTGSAEQTVPPVRSFTLPDRLIAVLLTKPRACATPVLLGLVTLRA